MSASSRSRRDLRSARFSPPQSAQPYRSIFGSSSQHHEDDQAGESDEEDEIEDILNEGLPPMADDSGDETYDASDEDVPISKKPGPDYGGKESREQKKKKKKGKEPARHRDADVYRSPSPTLYRPNRYRGPASTWRSWTQKERQNAEALETIRARDLSAHLFNAHALKRRARDIRKRVAEDDSLADDETSFVPSKLWTAWPMPAGEVPRVDEQVVKDPNDAWTIRRQPDMRPSAELEESLIAVMLKTAKERFRSRELMPKGYVWQKKERSRVDDGETSGNEGAWKSEPEASDGIQLRPVIQADDEKSRRQLRPLTRHILTRFDGLLMSLYHARKASAAPEESSASERQSEAESIVSRQPSPRKRSGTGVLERSRSRGRKRARTSSRSRSKRRASSNREDLAESVAASSDSSSSVSPSPSPARHESRGKPFSISRSRSRYGRRMTRLGLRDWSDVLGIASMTGWPSAAVMRTAQRCADLFGEDMIFRTLEEGSVRRIKTNNGGHIWKYSEDEELPPPKRVRSRPQSTKREAAAATAISKEEGEEQGLTKAPKGKGKHRKQDLVCPVKACARHTDGFSRTWNLNLHMKRVHPSYPWKGGTKSTAVVEDAQ